MKDLGFGEKDFGRYWKNFRKTRLGTSAILFFSKWVPYGLLEHCSNMPAGVCRIQSNTKGGSPTAAAVHFNSELVQLVCKGFVLLTKFDNIRKVTLHLYVMVPVCSSSLLKRPVCLIKLICGIGMNDTSNYATYV